MENEMIRAFYQSNRYCHDCGSKLIIDARDTMICNRCNERYWQGGKEFIRHSVKLSSMYGKVK
jgi:DNA-directed RNA polymerase subunit RPC12/RpoP